MKKKKTQSRRKEIFFSFFARHRRKACGRELFLSQPHFEGSVRSPLTLPKMGLGSPPGLSKTQNVIAGVKAPRIEVFFIPLERS